MKMAIRVPISPTLCVRIGTVAAIAGFAVTAMYSAQSVNGAGQTPSAARQTAKASAQPVSPALVQKGQELFIQNCAFCHGKDAGGGESGPDLTRSQLVADDVAGNKIGGVVRNGRVDKGMPKFGLADPDISALVAFVHEQKRKAETQQGGRKGVDVADLQTGNASAGKAYFEGAGSCAACHSPTGDLAGVATRLQGLKLEERMLYPRDAAAKVTVTLPSGETVSGKLAYKDEFTVGLRDASGRYRSWPLGEVNSKIDAPAEAHAQLLTKYTDADIHNLMAYLQTLH